MPVFFPPERCLGQAPVQAQPGPINASDAVVVEQPGLPPLEEDTGLDPFLETVVGGRSRTELGGIQGFPLTAGAQDEEDGIGADAVRSAGAPAAEGMPVDMRWEEDLQHFPQFIRDTPIVRDSGRIHGLSSCVIIKQIQEL